MRVYHFLDRKFGIKALKDRRLKIARLHELNDPFEFLSVDLSDQILHDAFARTKLQISERDGLLCFSKHWHNPVLWSHYAEKHRGICLGFDMPLIPPSQVSYVDTRFPMPEYYNQEFVRKLLFTKFKHWEYEEEYRVYISLNESIDGLYFADFGNNLILKSIILGLESSIEQPEIMDALGDIGHSVQLFKVKPSATHFRFLRTKAFSK